MRKSKYIVNALPQRAAEGEIAAGSRRWNGLPRAIRTGSQAFGMRHAAVCAPE